MAMSERALFQDQVAPAPEIAARFGDLHRAFSSQAAVVESNRCLYCFDAPCTTACPTHIDVPGFIKKIASGNLAGSARTILDANILGASCARACPVEVLCEGACVLHHAGQKPIKIGRLQRFAMEAMHASGAPLPFQPGSKSGRSVALVGAGPASLACAAELRRRGIAASIYDARSLPGGLNTYGIAEYKLPLNASLREIELLAQLGVTFHFECPIDASALAALERDHDAVFLGLGMGAIHQLGIAGEQLRGITNALDFIAEYKQGLRLSVPPRVAVVGAGNTAIDAAIAAVRLGAAEVYMLYRRDAGSMPAFASEYEHAKQEGVKFLWGVQPVGIDGIDHVTAIQLAPSATMPNSFLPEHPQTTIILPINLVILAIGQATHTDFLAGLDDGLANVQLDRGRVLIDRATGQTTHPNFFAGGDCTNGGREVVDAVADGKRAGIGIAAWLETQHAHA